jgi:plasmid stability protein
MGNLTITVDDDSLRKARIRALQEGTSVNSLLRDFLEAYAGIRSEQQNAVEQIAALSRKAASRRGQRKWTRDELHERS